MREAINTLKKEEEKSVEPTNSTSRGTKKSCKQEVPVMNLSTRGPEVLQRDTASAIFGTINVWVRGRRAGVELICG